MPRRRFGGSPNNSRNIPNRSSRVRRGPDNETAATSGELQGGGDKLVLADITEEGANLVALQTRQQLGISALSFAGNSEQSILSLFR